MPHTINGIGTWYYGKRNLIVEQGTCPHCNRPATLRSYDTRLFVVVLFLPTIPLRRYRVIRQCSLCTRHQVVPLADFEKAVGAAAEPLEARARAGDAGAGLELAKLLIANQRVDRARDHLEQVVRRHPHLAEAHWLLGAVQEMRGAVKDAAPAFEAALRLAPDDEKYLEAVAYNLVHRKDLAGAEARFRRLLEKKPGHGPWMFQLAEALKAQGKHREAARVFESLSAAVPEAASDPAVMKASIEAKKKAGIPLSRAEREALRAKGARRVKTVAVLAGLAAAAWFGFGALDGTVRVVVENGADDPVTLRVDDTPWITVPAHRYVQTTLRRGAHRVEATAGPRTDRFEVRADPGAWDNVFGSCLFVCNPFRLGVFAVETAVYGPGAPAEPDLKIGQRWFFLPVVDDLFRDPPGSQQVEKGRVKRRIVLRRRPDVIWLQIAGWLVSHGRANEAIDFLQQEASLPAAGLEPLAMLRYAATKAERTPEIDAWIASKRTPDASSLQFHRMHQTSLEQKGKRGALEKEYAVFLAERPASPMAHYLYGRVAPAAVRALEAYRKASSLDAAFPWGRLGAAWVLAAQGEDDEALKEYREYLRLRGSPALEAGYLWGALARTRQWVALAAELKPRAAPGAGIPDDPALQAWGRMLVLREAPDDEWRAWIDPVREKLKTDTWVTASEIERSRWRGEAVADELLERLETSPDPAGSADAGASARQAALVRFGLRLDAGAWADAEQALEEMWKAAPDGAGPEAPALLFAIAAEWGGETKRAKAWHGRVLEAVPPGPDADVARFLRGEVAPDALAAGDFLREGELRDIGLVARALRTADAAERGRLLDRALRSSAWEMNETAFLIRRMLQKAPPAGR